MSEDWRSLRVGDRIRIVRLPSGVDEPGYTFPPETREVFERLIARRRPILVSQILDGRPWVDCRTKGPNGRWVCHILAVDDDSWVRVRPFRSRTRRPPT